MAELVALDLPLGARLIAEVQRAYERGDAITIIDQRLSRDRQEFLHHVLRPARTIDESGPSTSHPNAQPVDNGDGLVVLTSGTSGVPKAAVLTWAAVIASATMTSAELRRGASTCWNACLPPSHIGGFAVLARTLFTDDTLIFGDARQLGVGPLHGATHVAVVRTQVARFDLSGYRVVLLGGSRPPEDVASNVVTTWGMTETGSGVVYNRRALPGVTLASVNGEIVVRSPTLFRCYRDNSAPFVRGPDGRDGWFRTGDAGDINDGVVTIHGRLDYVINSGGEKVWPEDLEPLLENVSGVSDLAVFGVDDKEWGQRVEVAVVTERDVDSLLAEFAEIAAARLGPWAKPKAVHRVDAIARTANGKIRRDELSRRFQLTPPVD